MDRPFRSAVGTTCFVEERQKQLPAPEEESWLAALFRLPGEQPGMKPGRLRASRYTNGTLAQKLSMFAESTKTEPCEATEITVDSDAHSEEAAEDSASNNADGAASNLTAQLPEPDEMRTATAGQLQEGLAGLSLPAAAAGRDDSIQPHRPIAGVEEVAQACQDQSQAHQHPGAVPDRAPQEDDWEERFLHAAQIQGMELEMETMGRGLEAKEQDILDFQFEMAALQSRLQDQAEQFRKKGEVVPMVSHELASGDNGTEIMRVAPPQQGDLLSQLQRQVAELSQELERSHAAYRALQQEHWAVIAK